MSDTTLPLAAHEIAQHYLERVGAFWSDPSDPAENGAMLDLFADNVDFYVPGD
ncbi:hypothetical protein [Brucella pituitosa]|uniref:hypothetical protein n=1 Tax=Brucella pituitosa TaxID=571256 RepID=UPI0012FE2F6C|nr:hypothetical protein [Brucella pituitosa]